MQEQLKLYDNYGLWHIPFWQKTPFMLVVGIVVLTLIFIAGRLYYKRRACRRLLPHERALKELMELKCADVCDPESAALFYVALTGIIKDYIGQLFAQNVCSYTDRQMIVYLEEKHLFNAQKERLKELFFAGELIKFACRQGLQERMQNDLQCAIVFVQETAHEVKNN